MSSQTENKFVGCTEAIIENNIFINIPTILRLLIQIWDNSIQYDDIPSLS